MSTIIAKGTILASVVSISCLAAGEPTPPASSIKQLIRHLSLPAMQPRTPPNSPYREIQENKQDTKHHHKCPQRVAPSVFSQWDNFKIICLINII